MPRLLLSLVTLFVLTTLASPVVAAPTAAQRCEADVELASGKLAQCRLTAQSKDSKAANPAKLTEALGKCSQKLSAAFERATLRYGAACAATEPSSAFDEYLKQCSDDTVAAAGGAALPDYVADLASCNADRATCDGDLTTCGGDLTTCTSDLTTCSGELGACTIDLAAAESEVTTCAGDLGSCVTERASAESGLAFCEADLAACANAPPARLIRTGQTTCWSAAGAVIPCAGTSQDGDRQDGLALAHFDNGDGTITDVNTGLMWEKLSDDDTIHDKDNLYSWEQALGKIAALNATVGFAGHTDWRMPNARELHSVVNLQNANPAVPPAFNKDCVGGCTVLTCSCTRYTGDAGLFYWSSSTYVVDPQFKWGVSFYNGSTNWAFASYFYAVRAVRGGS